MSDSPTRLKVLLALLFLSAVWALWPKKEEPVATATRPGRRQGSRSASVSDWDALPSSLDLVPKGDSPAQVDRNIFRFYDTPVPTPTRIPPPPTPIPQASFLGPWPLTPTPTPTPIVPPQITFTAIGLFGPPKSPIVVLESSGKLINAREGDVVEGRFQIRKINRESIDIGFTDPVPHEITRRLPITGMDR